MRKSNVKKLSITLTLVAMLLVVATNVQATIVNPLNIQGLGGNTTSNTTTNTTTNTIKNPVNPVTNTVKVNTMANTVVNNQNENLPQTGDASDYAIFLFIAVCAVVGIYAYRNYRNYNI